MRQNTYTKLDETLKIVQTNLSHLLITIIIKEIIYIQYNIIYMTAVSLTLMMMMFDTNYLTDLIHCKLGVYFWVSRLLPG